MNPEIVGMACFPAPAGPLDREVISAVHRELVRQKRIVAAPTLEIAGIAVPGQDRSAVGIVKCEIRIQRRTPPLGIHIESQNLPGLGVDAVVVRVGDQRGHLEVVDTRLGRIIRTVTPQADPAPLEMVVLEVSPVLAVFVEGDPAAGHVDFVVAPFVVGQIQGRVITYTNIRPSPTPSIVCLPGSGIERNKVAVPVIMHPEEHAPVVPSAPSVLEVVVEFHHRVAEIPRGVDVDIVRAAPPAERGGMAVN